MRWLSKGRSPEENQTGTLLLRNALFARMRWLVAWTCLRGESSTRWLAGIRLTHTIVEVFSIRFPILWRKRQRGSSQYLSFTHFTLPFLMVHTHWWPNERSNASSYGSLVSSRSPSYKPRGRMLNTCFLCWLHVFLKALFIGGNLGQSSELASACHI